MFSKSLFDWHKERSFFYAQSIWEYITGSIRVTMALIENSYTIIFIMIFRGHINILEEHIRGLCSDPLKSNGDNYEDLVGCIVKHKLILQ